MSESVGDQSVDQPVEQPVETDAAVSAPTSTPEDAPATEAAESPAADTGADASSDADPDAEDDGAEPGVVPRRDRVAELEAEGDIAADYLEELLDIADLDGDLDMDVEGDRAAVSIVGADLQQLVGPRGEVLEALQELTRLAVYRETGERSRLMLDISGYRAARRQELLRLAEETIASVREHGEPVSLQPMSPFERKVVHDAIAAAGLSSESEGVEPRRYVVVLPG